MRGMVGSLATGVAVGQCYGRSYRLSLGHEEGHARIDAAHVLPNVGHAPPATGGLLESTGRPCHGGVMEPDDPPPKVYGFKEREFKRDNVRIPDAPPVPTARDHAVMAGPPVPASRKPAAAKPGDPNDVHAVLQNNRAVEKKLGLDEMEIKKVKSRRQRDYWLLLVSSEMLLGVITWQGRANPFVFVGALAGMVLAGVSITWIMWQVMDKY